MPQRTSPACSTRTRLLFCIGVMLSYALSVPAQLAHKSPAANISRARALAPFDVISVKQNNNDAQSGNIDIDDHGIFRVTNMPLEIIVEFAYDVKSDQIAGLIGPASDARFDITAKLLPPDAGPPPERPDADMQAMIILLLEDRFHLKVHLEPKTKPIYNMVVARGGPKIKLSQEEIHDNSWNINGENTNKVLTSKAATMTDLANALADEVHRPVIDKTGLTGHADITLKWSDDVAAEAGGPNIISIFTAVEEQLGLKLQSAKGPVDTLVIDHIEMPSQN